LLNWVKEFFFQVVKPQSRHTFPELKIFSCEFERKREEIHFSLMMEEERPAGGAPAASEQNEPAGTNISPLKKLDIFELVRVVKNPLSLSETIDLFSEVAYNDPNKLLRDIFTFLRAHNTCENDKLLILNLAHELLLVYATENVVPPSESEQLQSLEALKMVYVDQGIPEEIRREVNNIVSLVWRLSDEIDETSPNQVTNFTHLLRYCLDPSTHTGANSEVERHLLTELGLTLFSRIMHELVRELLLALVMFLDREMS